MRAVAAVLVAVALTAAAQSDDIMFMNASHVMEAPLPPQPPAAAVIPFLVSPIQLYGLANRLRALEMAHLMATLSGRPLAVHWTPATDCNVNFRELFNSSVLAKSGILVDASGDAGLDLEFERANNNTVFKLRSNIPVIEGSRKNVWDVRNALHQLAALPVPMALEVWHVARPLHMPCQSYFTHRSHFLRALQPVDWIAEGVEAFYAAHMRYKLVIGVHVRMDREFDDASIPEASSANQYSTFEEIAPLHLFEEAWVVARLRDTFPGRILSFVSSAQQAQRAGCDSHSYDPGLRNSRCGTMMAFIDFQLLARTSMIIGSYFSSFSEEAALMHLTPRVMIHRNGNLMGFDLSSPGCGNFYEKPGNPADNLVMERKPFEVRADPFPSFTEAWGMTRVYKMIQTPPA